MQFSPAQHIAEKMQFLRNGKQCEDVISKSPDANVFLRRSLWASEVSKIGGRPPSLLGLFAHVGALVTASRDGGDGREIVSRQRSQTGKNTPTLARARGGTKISRNTSTVAVEKAPCFEREKFGRKSCHFSISVLCESKWKCRLMPRGVIVGPKMLLSAPKASRKESKQIFAGLHGA